MAKNKKPKRKYQQGKVIAGGHLKLSNEILKRKELSVRMALEHIRTKTATVSHLYEVGRYMGEGLSLIDEDNENLPQVLSICGRYHQEVTNFESTGEQISDGLANDLTNLLDGLIDLYRTATKGDLARAELLSAAMQRKYTQEEIYKKMTEAITEFA